MRAAFYFSGEMKSLNTLCTNRLSEFSEFMGWEKPLCFTHEPIESNPYGDKFEYIDAKVLAPYFYATRKDNGVDAYTDALERKHWNKFSDLVTYFGSRSVYKTLFKFDADIYILDFDKMKNLVSGIENLYDLDALFMDCDTRGSGVPFLNAHMSIMNPSSKWIPIFEALLNHEFYFNMMLDHYNFTGPHLMNNMFMPLFKNGRTLPISPILIPADYNGYSKERVREFDKTGDLSVFNGYTWVHLVGSQLTNWTEGKITYNDKDNLWKEDQ